MNTNDAQELVKIASDLAPEVYDDLAKPVMHETGALLGKLPGYINALLTPLDVWKINRLYRVEEAKLLVAKKLEHIAQEKIVPPEPHIAIPAFQAISYAMDAEILRDMYANLLAKSMNVDTKENVHPSFVECIKQLSPLDAENIQYFKAMQPVVEYQLSMGASCIPLLANAFLGNPERASTKDIARQAISVSALQRLGLINVKYGEILSQDNAYDAFNQPEVLDAIFPARKISPLSITKGHAKLTPYGISFMLTCVDDGE